MKKILTLLTALCLSLSLCACGEKEAAEIPAGTVVPVATAEFTQDTTFCPLYNRLTTQEQNVYAHIVTTLLNFGETTPELYKTSTKEDAMTFGQQVQDLYREILFEQSEIFWVDPYKSQMMLQEYNGTFTVFIKPVYILTQAEAQPKIQQLNQVLDQIVTTAQSKATTFEKVLYVYDYIMENCYYDHALVGNDKAITTGISAYGCLVEGKTICSGYTLAFDAAMKRLGYECGAEFDSYDNFSLQDGHVWNYCKLDGEYYYFDLTWDDTGFDDVSYQSYFPYSHNYFAVTRDELSLSNSTMTKDAPTPLCSGTAYNYFIHQGYNLSQYSADAAKQIIDAQADQGYAVIRFDSADALAEAQADLLEGGKIYEMVDGLTSISYVVSNAGLHLYILFPQ